LALFLKIQAKTWGRGAKLGGVLQSITALEISFRKVMVTGAGKLRIAQAAKIKQFGVLRYFIENTDMY
jgi:hypothetical protein